MPGQDERGNAAPPVASGVRDGTREVRLVGKYEAPPSSEPLVIEKRVALCHVCSKTTKQQRSNPIALWTCEFDSTHPAAIAQKYVDKLIELERKLTSTQEQLDAKTQECYELRLQLSNEAPAPFADVPPPPCECDNGWYHIQHPMKPPGVIMSSFPCKICNPERAAEFEKAIAGITFTRTP